MNRYVKAALLALLVVGLAGSIGCRRVPRSEADDVQTRTEAIELRSATSADVEIAMGAGELQLRSGDESGTLLKGEFSYAPARLRPEIESDLIGDRFDVRVSHPDSPEYFGRNMHNEWDVRLAQGVPMDLKVQLGAGDGDLDLTNVDLGELEVEMGAGDLSVDLSGERARDLDGRIEAGVGRVTVSLPEGVGVRVSGFRDGVGDWKYNGLTRDGDYLVNDAYDEAETKIELDIQRGAGEVVLELVD